MVENAGMGPTSPEAWMAMVVGQQCQKAEEQQWVLHRLMELQYTMLNQPSLLVTPPPSPATTSDSS